MAMRVWRIATGLLTFVMLVFSEIFPKTVAAMHPEKVGLFSSHILVLLLKIFLSASLVNEYFHENVNANGGFKT